MSASPAIRNITIYRDGIPETGNVDLDGEALCTDVPDAHLSRSLYHLEHAVRSYRGHQLVSIHLVCGHKPDVIVWEEKGGFPEEVRSTQSPASEELLRLYGKHIPPCVEKYGNCVLLLKYK